MACDSLTFRISCFQQSWKNFYFSNFTVINFLRKIAKIDSQITQKNWHLFGRFWQKKCFFHFLGLHGFYYGVRKRHHRTGRLPPFAASEVKTPLFYMPFYIKKTRFCDASVFWPPKKGGGPFFNFWHKKLTKMCHFLIFNKSLKNFFLPTFTFFKNEKNEKIVHE